VRGRQRETARRDDERGGEGGKEGTRARGKGVGGGTGRVEKRGGRLRLLICIRKTKGVGPRCVPYVPRNEEPGGSQSDVSSLFFSTSFSRGASSRQRGDESRARAGNYRARAT